MRFVAPKSVVMRVRGGLDRLLTAAAIRIDPNASDDLELRLAPGGVVWREFLDAGRTLIRVGRFEEADEVLRRALAAFPNDRDLMIELAMSAHNSGRYMVAIERWTLALAAAPDVAMCHAGLAANRRMIGDCEGATALIEAALDRFPADLIIITEAARCAEQRAAFGTALALWEKAVATTHPHPDWLRGKARAVASLSRVDEACAVPARADESLYL